MLAPTNGIWAANSPSFSWSASTDNFALGKYELWIDNALNRDSISVSAISAYPIAPLSGGFHTWNVKAIDKAGNARQSNQTWSVRVDDEAPASFLSLTPADSMWSPYGKENFTWSPSSDAGAGLAKYALNIGTTKKELSATQTSYQFTEVLASGPYQWYVQAIDAVGNIRESDKRRILLVDNTPPNTFILIAPANNSWTRDATPLFEWQATQDAGSGLSKYELFIDSKMIIDNISPPATSVELDSTLALKEGSHTWNIIAVDALGNTRPSTQTFTLKIDLTPPVSFSLKSPADSSFANFPTPDFSWNTSSDNLSGLSHYSLWIDDVLSVDNITGTASSPSVPLAEGPHVWHVRAVDKVGNWRASTQHWTIIGEWNPPEPFDLAFPSNGATVNSSLPAFGWHRTTDIGSGVEKYQLWIDGILNSDNIPTTDSLAIPKNPISNGSHYWFIKAIDNAGNERPSSSTWQIIIDRSGNKAPVIQTVSAATAAEDQLFQLKIAASDPNSADVLRFTDNTDLFDIDRFSGEISFTPTNEDVGEHNITITATDGDLSDSTNFVLTVQNVNDAPFPFSLLYPAHFAIIDILNPTLVWHKSVDIDKGDRVIYCVSIDTVAIFASPTIFDNIADTTFIVPYGLKKSTEYFWKVEARDLAGAVATCESFFKFITSATATKVWYAPNGQTPESYALLQNYPNPFNPETAITFQLPRKEKVEIIIFNQVGQIIRHLVDEEMQAGYRQVIWDAKNERGELVASGIYLCQMVAGGYRGIIKMLLLK